MKSAKRHVMAESMRRTELFPTDWTLPPRGYFVPVVAPAESVRRQRLKQKPPFPVN